MKFEINIEKKHFWILIAVIVLLFGVVIVIAAVPWTDDKPFHEPLYTDTISSKSGSGVTVDDNLEVTGSIILGGISRGIWPIEEMRCYGQGGALYEDLISIGGWTHDIECKAIADQACGMVNNCVRDTYQHWVRHANWYDICIWKCRYTG